MNASWCCAGVQAQKEYPQMGELARQLESLRWSTDSTHAAAAHMLGSAQRLSIYSRHAAPSFTAALSCFPNVAARSYLANAQHCLVGSWAASWWC